MHSFSIFLCISRTHFTHNTSIIIIYKCEHVFTILHTSKKILFSTYHVHNVTLVTLIAPHTTNKALSEKNPNHKKWEILCWCWKKSHFVGTMRKQLHIVLFLFHFISSGYFPIYWINDSYLHPSRIRLHHVSIFIYIFVHRYITRYWSCH